MTIPLDTYDPDWEKKWEAIHAELEAEYAKPYDDERRDRTRELTAQMLDAYHAQFRTTGDYAQWTENNLRQMLTYKHGIEDFNIPSFPLDNSVAATRKLYSAISERMNIQEKAALQSLALDYPVGEAPFAFNLDSGETRTLGTVTQGYTRLVFQDDNIAGVEPTAAPYSCVLEKRHSTVNACFFQLHGEGPSVVNSIEDLATTLYHAELGPAADQNNRDAYLPEQPQMFISIFHHSMTGKSGSGKSA